jgi:hypothetical protein
MSFIDDVYCFFFYLTGFGFLRGVGYIFRGILPSGQALCDFGTFSPLPSESQAEAQASIVFHATGFRKCGFLVHKALIAWSYGCLLNTQGCPKAFKHREVICRLFSLADSSSPPFFRKPCWIGGFERVSYLFPFVFLPSNFSAE